MGLSLQYGVYTKGFRIQDAHTKPNINGIPPQEKVKCKTFVVHISTCLRNLGVVLVAQLFKLF